MTRAAAPNVDWHLLSMAQLERHLDDLKAIGKRPTAAFWTALRQARRDAPARAAMISFRGQKRDGTTGTGVQPACTSAADLAEHLYRQGWRWATITRDAAEVGGVGPDPGHASQRVWWGRAATGMSRKGARHELPVSS